MSGVADRRRIARSIALLVAATACGGVAAALGYRGTLAGINAIAPAERRSEVVSSYLGAVYCGNALPVIGVGLVSRLVSAPIAHALFAVFIAAIAAGAFCQPTAQIAGPRRRPMRRRLLSLYSDVMIIVAFRTQRGRCGLPERANGRRGSRVAPQFPLREST